MSQHRFASHGGDDRRPRFFVVFLALALLLVATASACGGDDEGNASGDTSETASCPLDDGEVNIFSTADVSAVAGDITPMQLRWIESEVPKISAAGGVLGCTLDIEVVDEPLPDFESGIRKYRAALASEEYDLYFAMFDSALVRALPKFTNRAKKILILAGVGDHQPFYEELEDPSYAMQAGVSTLGEGRAAAKFAADKGWKKIAILTPNYAYGQDVADAFKEYFLELVPDGEITTEQKPAFLEKNFQPFVNAVVASKPDAVFGGQYGADIISLYKLWKAQDLTIPTIFFTEQSVLEQLKPAQIPENSYGYDRGAPNILRETPRGQYVWDAYSEEYGTSDHPTPGSYVFIIDSAIQLVQALAEKTNGFDADAWTEAIKAGGFAYESAYQEEPTDVNHLNFEANTCATVGLVKFSEELSQGFYDPEDSAHVCLDEVIDDEEREELIGR
jgi:ABC-type branched-subunit amino acid transport system substrate-binding protein